MLTVRIPSCLLGLLACLLGVSLFGLSPAAAQDRSVPRFGPLVDPDTVQAGPFDVGRQWSFAQPPLDYLEETYGVPADERGLRHVRRSTVRLPGCSGALVSPDGLLLTAARCVRPHLPASAEDDGLRTDAFLADPSAQERALPALYAEQVVDIADVTDRVTAQLDEAPSALEAPSPRTAAMAAVQEQLSGDLSAGQRVEVVSETGGARYVAYTYRRYDDVRLVFLPDPAVTLFGLPDQLLSYPQHAWDVAALRVYDDGQPLSTPDHFDLRSQGARPGDAVFAVGYPAEQPRAETAEQLAVRRDVTLPARRAALETWTEHLQTYTDTATAETTSWVDRLHEAGAALKDLRAQLDALQSSYFQARLQARDAKFRRQAPQSASEESNGAGLLDSLAALQEEKRGLADSYRAFSFLLRPEHSSATLRRAALAYQAREEGREVSREALPAVPQQPAALDAALMDAHRQRLQAHLGADAPPAVTEAGSAASIVRRSVFSDPDSTRALLEQGTLPSEDPALEVVAALYDQYAPFASEWARLLDQEARLTDALARVRHEQTDAPIALSSARAPRLADGRVRSYSFNGTVAASFTTFYGLYGYYHSTGASSSLPDRWSPPPAGLDRSTPLTTVSSTDMSGEHGGPLLNATLQLVGIQTDGNIQSAGGAYLFLPRRMRTVSVDIRGVLEGLSSVYEAEGLVQEMTDAPDASSE